MNGGDVYVLDCMTIVYVWFGSSANEEKRITGIMFGKQLADVELARIVCVEEVETPLAFWQAMGGQHLIRPPSLDAAVEFRAALYAVDESRSSSTASDRLVVARGRDIVRSLLNTSMCYVIDAVERLFIWAGDRENSLFLLIFCGSCVDEGRYIKKRILGAASRENQQVF